MASCLIGGCVVRLPGNLDAGDDGSTDNGDMDDGPDPTAEGSSDDGPDPTAEGSTGGDDMPGDGDGGDDMPGDGDGDGCQAPVDILMIIDNSGSMELLQRRLAESMGSLISPLDDAGVDWRLAMTTTDVGNMWCPPELTTSEMGEFQLQSCKEHLNDFLFGNDVDVKDLLCNDICPYLPGEIYTLPTTTADDPVSSPRPWMERIGGASNLPAGIDPVTASLCLVPQGINGCGFEQPLEAMALALDRATTPGLPESGFLRDDASLLVVILTNEVDCSTADESIFSVDGDKVFFSDPTSSVPTSAVCWNAGVSCLGEGPTYTDCVATNYAADGNPAMPDDAVLHPLHRYTDLLNQLEQDKRSLDLDADVEVLVIAGVGTDGELNYTDVSQTDPDYQDMFGIGPGCTSMDPLIANPARAVPPVRLREFAATMSDEPLASICADNYSGPFQSMQARLLDQCGN